MCLSCGCGSADADHNDSRNITLLTLRSAAQWANLSLQEAAANLTKTLADCMMKEIPDLQRSTAGIVLKAADEDRFLLTVAYPAFKPDTAIAADGHIDFASDRVVEKACWNFARKGMRVGMWHKPGYEGAAEVVENYIYRRDDPWIIKAPNGTNQVIMKGDWLTGLVLKPDSWEQWKKGLIGGVSPQGGARRISPTPESLERVRRRLASGNY